MTATVARAIERRRFIGLSAGALTQRRSLAGLAGMMYCHTWRFYGQDQGRRHTRYPHRAPR